MLAQVRDDFAFLPLSRRALEHASIWHAGQTRAVDGAPFLVHPREVASLLFAAGQADHVVAAGMLHDVLEKTDVTRTELSRVMGEQVTRLVAAATEDPSLPDYEDRKRELRARIARTGPEALAILAADKISKVRELRLDGDGTMAQAERVHHYAECLAVLAEHLPQSTLVRRLREEFRGADLSSRPASTAAPSSRPPAASAAK